MIYESLLSIKEKIKEKIEGGMGLAFLNDYLGFKKIEIYYNNEVNNDFYYPKQNELNGSKFRDKKIRSKVI